MANECTRLLYEISALVVPISHSCAGKARMACLLESNTHLLKIKKKCTFCDKTEEKCNWSLLRYFQGGSCHLPYFAMAKQTK